jgi:ankyrin repeat protein
MKICRYLRYTLLFGIALSSTMLASSPEEKYEKFMSQCIETDDFGVPFLVIEASKGRTEYVKYLLAHTANQEFDNKALLEASARGHDEIVKDLLLHGAEIETRDYHGDTALALAVRGEHLDVIQALLDAKASMNTPNNQGQSPQDLAAESNNHELKALFTDAMLKSSGFIPS